MIKEKRKNKKYKKLTLKQELTRYIRTAGISMLAATIFTLLLSFHARSEMIKNLYITKEERLKFEKIIAQKIVSHSDLTATLHDKSYLIVMQVGDLYRAAGDLQKAEYAYHIGHLKAPSSSYVAHSKLCTVLISQDKIKDAEELINSVQDSNNLSLIRFKTRVYIVLGDKYYSMDKYLKAANAYEKAYYYYNTLAKKDKLIKEAIKKRMVKTYIETAGVMVRNGYNSDAIRFLKKALKYDPNNLSIQYRIAVVYADLDPIISIDYFEPLISKIPQDIDYETYSKVLMKAANIMDIQGNSVKAKLYRYKIHSLDMYINQKVLYKNDVDVFLDSFTIKKVLFSYKLKSTYRIKNVSSLDMNHLYAEFILRNGKKTKESIKINIASKAQPLYSNGGESSDIVVEFGKNIFTKRELKHYYIDIYLYKEPKFKTLITTVKIPVK